MYHIRLIKGMSYSGAVTATRRYPDVFTEDEAEYTSAMKSGYFADLTTADEKIEHGKENLEQEDAEEHGKENLEQEDAEEHGKENLEQEEEAFADMNVDELRAYAEINGISLAGAKKKADIISAIREAEAKAAEARSVLRGEQ